MPIPVIDMWAPIVPVPEVTAYTVDNFPDADAQLPAGLLQDRATQEAFRARAAAIATPLEGVIGALDAAASPAR